MDKKELRVTESFKASDSSSKIRGVVSIYDKQGNIVFSKENLIVQSGRQYFLSLASRALGYTDEFANRRLGFVYLKKGDGPETATDSDTVDSINIGYNEKEFSDGCFKDNSGKFIDGFVKDGNGKTNIAKYALNLVGSGNSSDGKSALFCVLKDKEIPSVVVDAPSNIEVCVFQQNGEGEITTCVSPEVFPIPTLSYLGGSAPAGVDDKIRITMTIDTTVYDITDYITKDGSLKNFFSKLVTGELMIGEEKVTLPDAPENANDGYSGSFKIEVLRKTGVGESETTDNIVSPIVTSFKLKDFRGKDIAPVYLAGAGYTKVERDSIFLDAELNYFGNDDKFTLDKKEGYVDTSSEGIQSIVYYIFCKATTEDEEDVGKGTTISLTRYVNVVPEKTTIYNTEQAAVYDNNATYAIIQPSTENSEIKELSITLYNFGYNFASSIFDEIGLLLSNSEADINNVVENPDEMLFSRLKMAEITVGSSLTYDIVYKIYF